MKKLLLTLMMILTMTFSYGQTFTQSTIMGIPDNAPETCSSLTVSGIGIMSNTLGLEEVCIEINHTYDADLDVYLVAPDGITRIELTTDNGGGGNNYSVTCFRMDNPTAITSGSAPFNGGYIPEGDLIDFNGVNADGVWQLCIEDDAGGDTGNLIVWTLYFGNNPPQKNCNWYIGLYNSFDTYDYLGSYGAGWGGADIDIIINGVNIGYSYLIYTDNGLWITGTDGFDGGVLITYELNVNDGDVVDIIYNNGSYDSENAYFIYDETRTLFHEEGNGNFSPNSYSFTVTGCSKKPYTTNDCEGAIKVCDGTYSYALSAVGDGKYEELAGRASCWGGDILYWETVAPLGEKNSTWYIFDVQTSGSFQFTIDQTSYNTSDDYDWALFDLSSNLCDDIVNGTLSEVRCNWEISTISTGINIGGAGVGWESSFNVTAGEKYALVVDNWSTGGSGYDLDLNQGTANIFDNISPELQGVTSHSSDTIYFSFNEGVLCSSVTISDFDVDGPSGGHIINTLGSDECDAGAEYAQHYWITVSPAIAANESYTLDLVSDVSDPCTNPTNQNDDTFLPVEFLGANYDCETGKLLWSTSSENNNAFYKVSVSTEFPEGKIVEDYSYELNGHGNTNSMTEYELSLNIQDGKYIHLTQTDYDGTTVLLDVIHVVCEKPDIVVSIVPNPSDEGTTQRIIGEYKTIKIYDIIGKEIHVPIINNEIIGLSAGIYIVIINDTYKVKIIIN